MFGWLFPRSPLHDPREKAWTEVRMQWLSEQFGLEALKNATVLLPTQEHFPEPFHGTEEDARRLIQRLCDQFHIRPTDIELKVHADTELPDAAGMYEEDNGRTVVRLTASQLSKPENLVATLAHELAHRRLLGEGRMSAKEPDHERLADLLPVYFGAGLFGANATVQDRSTRDGGWAFWSISRQGSVPSRVFGYAFALFAWTRGERKPAWAEYLRKDAHEVFTQGLKYLQKTEDSLFHPETAGRQLDPPTIADLTAELTNGTPSRRIAAMWKLQKRGDDSHSAIDALLRCTRDRSAILRAMALETLAGIGVRSPEVQDEAMILLRDAEAEVRSSAAAALGAVAVQPETAINELTATLGDSSFRVSASAAHALSEFGRDAEQAAEAIVKPLRRALVHGEAYIAGVYLHAVLALHHAPDAFVREAIDDAELLRHAEEILSDLRRTAAETAE